MNNRGTDFQQYVDMATYYIGDLLVNFACEVEALSPTDTDRITYANELIGHLRYALIDSIKVLDELEDMLAPFKEPVPVIAGGDFEADVLRDLSNLNNPRHRPVSKQEVGAWSTEYIKQQNWKA